MYATISAYQIRYDMKKNTKINLPVSTSRNPTVVPMLKLTKPGRHTQKTKAPLDNKYFE